MFDNRVYRIVNSFGYRFRFKDNEFVPAWAKHDYYNTLDEARHVLHWIHDGSGARFCGDWMQIEDQTGRVYESCARA